MKMIEETFYSAEENGEEGMRRKCQILEEEGWTIVSTEHGMVKQAGSDVPGAANFGMIEPGYIIKVEKPHPNYLPKHAKTRKRRQDLDHPSRWLWEA